jgi:hypothetical protein
MILVEGYELAQTITLPKGNVGKGQAVRGGALRMGRAKA